MTDHVAHAGRDATDTLPDFMTQAEVAALFRCDPRTIRNWTNLGLLNPIRVNRRPLYARPDVINLVTRSQS